MINNNRRHRVIKPVFLCVLVVSVLAVPSIPRLVSAAAATSVTARPPQWAAPMQLEGAPNLHKIHAGLYRSAQPTKEGMKNLDKMGVKTIINLRAFHSDAGNVKGTALLNDELNIKTWHIEDEDVIHVLRIIGKKENGPFLIHCQHGADRTGVMSAMYRIVVQGWSKDEAIREMTEGGYGFHPVWENVITYVKNADVEKIRREAVK
jgi:protein tyrosine/serine phosphatase